MKLPDEEVERLTMRFAAVYQDKCFGAGLQVGCVNLAIRAILAELPEPQAPEWATKEAKAVVAWAVALRDGLQKNCYWGGVGLIDAYLASLKTKTKVLPEWWVVVSPYGVSLHDTEADARQIASEGANREVRYVPSRTVEDK